MSIRVSGYGAAVALAVSGWMVVPTKAQQPAGANAMAAKLDAIVKEAAALPTPQIGGHPDLNGYWQVPRPQLPPPASGAPRAKSVAPFSYEDLVRVDLAANKRIEDPSLRPVYKPEFVAKVKENFEKSSLVDPSYRCQSDGVPRIGAPTEIVQVPGAVYFLYADRNIFRVIPTDGRKHDEAADAMSMGDSIGRWEDSTLIVDVVNFSPDTWLDRDGAIHDQNLHVIEKFTRQGNTLKYEVTAEDPTLFLQPFTAKPKTLILGKAGQHAGEDYPCIEQDQDHLVTHEHH
jgi:hypothetical protein